MSLLLHRLLSPSSQEQNPSSATSSFIMAPLSKFIALCAFAATFAAAVPMAKPADAAALAAREAMKLDIITKNGEDYAMVPIKGNYGKDVTIHLGPLPEEVKVEKRGDVTVDTVAYVSPPN